VLQDNLWISTGQPTLGLCPGPGSSVDNVSGGLLHTFAAPDAQTPAGEVVVAFRALEGLVHIPTGTTAYDCHIEENFFR